MECRAAQTEGGSADLTRETTCVRRQPGGVPAPSQPFDLTSAYRAADATSALDGLIDFHLDFALGESDLIRIQDRDFASLPPSAKRQVRKAQRQYVEIWVDVLRKVDTSLAEADARLMAHATFGLLNSTPHSLKPDAGRTAVAASRPVLRAMTSAALRRR